MATRARITARHLRHAVRVGERVEEPEYGPGGYLPERAAKRARKIVLREQMGIGWPLAAVGAAVLVATVGLTFLLRSGPPDPPFRAIAPLTSVAPSSAELVESDNDELLVVRAGGTVRVFSPPADQILWCEASRRLESSAGQVWTLDGILVGGSGVSLRTLPSTVYDGRLYVDPTAPDTALPADPRDETPAC
jgi:hypothetical protein